jgi:hypothetical protein
VCPLWDLTLHIIVTVKLKQLELHKYCNLNITVRATNIVSGTNSWTNSTAVKLYNRGNKKNMTLKILSGGGSANVEYTYVQSVGGCAGRNETKDAIFASYV